MQQVSPETQTSRGRAQALHKQAHDTSSGMQESPSSWWKETEQNAASASAAARKDKKQAGVEACSTNTKGGDGDREDGGWGQKQLRRGRRGQ